MTEIQIETMDETEAYQEQGNLTDEQLDELNEATEPDDEGFDPEAGSEEGLDEIGNDVQDATELALEDVVQDILDAKEFGDELTMYQVAKVLNAALEVFDVQKDDKLYQVRPQMVYNYNRNKMVAKGEVLEKATKEQTSEFVVRFVGKRI